MTDQEMLELYRENLPDSLAAALRGVYNAGYYHGAGLTMTANSQDRSGVGAAKPANPIKIKR